ncbi:MAG: HAD family phosphatase [Propionibacteriaceae bacterium]|nr:HAD family phosphatase [Propionibacteriaceae bacterium]
MAITKPAAVLIDFDGTLVDTEPYWMQGEVDLLAEFGVAWTLEEASGLCGTSREYSQAVLKAQMANHGVDVTDLDDDVFYAELCDSVVDRINRLGAPALPGVSELLTDIAAHGLPCAVVSASPPGVLAAGLAGFPEGVIQAVVNGEMVEESKPAPEGYLLAASMLGVDASDCVVIEDTVSGVAAGLAAGAVVVAVPRLQVIHDAPRQVILPSLEGVDVAKLAQLYRQGRGTGHE